MAVAEASLAAAISSYESSVNSALTAYNSAIAGQQESHSTSVSVLAETFNGNVTTIQSDHINNVASLAAAFGTTVDGLNSTLESETEAADAAWFAATTASADGFDATVTALNTQFGSAESSANAVREVAAQAASAQFSATEAQAIATFDAVALSADSTYETAVQAHEEWLIAEESLAFAAFEAATDDSPTGIGGVFNATVSLAETTRDNDLALYSHVTYDVSAVSTIDLETLWSTELAAIEPTISSAAATRDASIEAAEAAYDAAIQSATDLYGSLMEAADAARTGAYEQADDVFLAAAAVHQTDYDQAVSALEDARQSAVQAAADQFAAAAVAAEASYSAAVNAARESLDNAIAAAEEEFSSWQAGTLPGQTLTTWIERWQIFDTSGGGLAVRWELRRGTGWSSGEASVTIQKFPTRPEPAILNEYQRQGQPTLRTPLTATGLSDTEVALVEHFVAPLEALLRTIGSVTISGRPVTEILPPPANQNPWEIQEYIQTVNYLVQLDQLQTTYDSAVAVAQQSYDSAVAAASATFNTAVFGSTDGSVQPGSMTDAFQSAQAAANTTFQNGEESAYDLYLAAEAAFYAAAGMDITTPVDDTLLREAARDYQVDTAALSVNHVAEAGAAWVAYVTGVTAAETARDNAMITAESRLGLDMARAGTDLASGQIAADDGWASSLIDIRAEYAIARTEKQTELAGEVADAQLAFELTEHAAAETLAQSLIQASTAREHAVIDADTTLTLGEAVEGEDLSNDLAREDEVRQNAFASADAVWLSVGAAAEVASTAVAASAENTLIQSIASELTAFASAFTTQLTTASQNVINAIDTAYVDYHTGNADHAAVSGIWTTFYTEVINAAQTAMQNETTAWDACLNEVGRDIETSLNNIAAEAVPRAAAYGNALTASVSTVAAAATTAVSQEAAAVTTWISNLATQANAVLHSAIAAWQAMANSDATAATAQVDNYSNSFDAAFDDYLDENEFYTTAFIEAERSRKQLLSSELTAMADQAIAEDFQLTVAGLSEWESALQQASWLDDAFVIAMAELDSAEATLAATRLFDDVAATPVGQWLTEQPRRTFVLNRDGSIPEYSSNQDSRVRQQLEMGGSPLFSQRAPGRYADPEDSFDSPIRLRLDAVPLQQIDQVDALNEMLASQAELELSRGIMRSGIPGLGSYDDAGALFSKDATLIERAGAAGSLFLDALPILGAIPNIRAPRLGAADDVISSGTIGSRSMGAAEWVPETLQSRGHTMRQGTATRLNEFFEKQLNRREWGRALERFKEATGLPPDYHSIKIREDGSLQLQINNVWETVDNLEDYLH